MKVCNISSLIFPTIVKEEIADNKVFEITYKHGQGHFKIDMAILIVGFNQTEFKKVVEMIESSDNSETLAAYLNLNIKKIYNRFRMELKGDSFTDELTRISNWLKKRNEILAKKFSVSPLDEMPKVEDEQEVQKSDNMTELKKCNVIRYIPTQVSPIWENGKVITYIGYNFEYKGMPLQAYRSDGWENKNSTVTRVFIVDPVIGLPIAQYDGMLSGIESKLDECFLKYLATIENNKESIVLIANAFKKLKETA